MNRIAALSKGLGLGAWGLGAWGLRAWAVNAAMILMVASPSPALAQVTTADYQRAQALRQQYESAAVFVPDTPTWVGTTHRFYYRRSLANGFEFVMVDADTQQKQPAFDHNRLAT